MRLGVTLARVSLISHTYNTGRVSVSLASWNETIPFARSTHKRMIHSFMRVHPSTRGRVLKSQTSEGMGNGWDVHGAGSLGRMGGLGRISSYRIALKLLMRVVNGEKIRHTETLCRVVWLGHRSGF